MAGVNRDEPIDREITPQNSAVPLESHSTFLPRRSSHPLSRGSILSRPVLLTIVPFNCACLVLPQAQEGAEQEWIRGETALGVWRSLVIIRLALR